MLPTFSPTMLDYFLFIPLLNFRLFGRRRCRKGLNIFFHLIHHPVHPKKTDSWKRIVKERKSPGVVPSGLSTERLTDREGKRERPRKLQVAFHSLCNVFICKENLGSVDRADTKEIKSLLE